MVSRRRRRLPPCPRYLPLSLRPPSLYHSENDFNEAEMARLTYQYTSDSPVPEIVSLHERIVAQKKKVLDDSTNKKMKWQAEIEKIEAEMATVEGTTAMMECNESEGT